MIGPARHLRNLKERLRFRYTPRIVDWLVGIASFRATKKLTSGGKLRILVDNTVLYHAVTHETGWVSTGAKSWGQQLRATGYAARMPVHAADIDTREYVNVCFLPGIAHLCRNGLVELVTSAELQDEQFRQPSGRYRGYGYFDHSLFGDLKVDSVDGYVFPTMGPAYFGLPSAEDQQRERIGQHRSHPAFDTLVRTLGPANSQDAWHIFTAEASGCFCFLTMDFKLIRTVAAQSGSAALKRLATRVMTPEMLGIELGLLRVPPHLFSYHDASFIVRSDISMPGSQRRPRKNYRDANDRQ